MLLSAIGDSLRRRWAGGGDAGGSPLFSRFWPTMESMEKPRPLRLILEAASRVAEWGEVTIEVRGKVGGE